MSRIALLVFVATTVTALPTVAQNAKSADKAPRLVAPLAKGTINTDGTIEDGEWKGAYSQTLSESTTLLVRYAKEGLQLAIKNPRPAILSVFLEIEGKVYVLHSSARLGTAIYEKNGKEWSVSQKFAYQNPSKDFFKKEAWRANVMKMGGRGDVECVVAPKLLGISKKGKRRSKKKPPEVRVCIVHGGFSPGGSPAWPRVSDGTTDRNLLMGHTPDSLSFQPEKWGVIELGGGKKK